MEQAGNSLSAVVTGKIAAEKASRHDEDPHEPARFSW